MSIDEKALAYVNESRAKHEMRPLTSILKASDTELLWGLRNAVKVIEAAKSPHQPVVSDYVHTQPGDPLFDGAEEYRLYQESQCADQPDSAATPKSGPNNDPANGDSIAYEESDSARTLTDQPDEKTIAEAIVAHCKKYNSYEGVCYTRHMELARTIAGLTERESVKGFYVCNHCNNTELVQRETICWRCGFGDMGYHEIKLLPLTMANEIEGGK
jgi:hypothetical protein